MSWCEARGRLGGLQRSRRDRPTLQNELGVNSVDSNSRLFGDVRSDRRRSKDALRLERPNGCIWSEQPRLGANRVQGVALTTLGGRRSGRQPTCAFAEPHFGEMQAG